MRKALWKRLPTANELAYCFIRVEPIQTLGHSDVEALIVSAVAHANAPLPVSGIGKLIIRSISAKQRPRS